MDSDRKETTPTTCHGSRRGGLSGSLAALLSLSVLLLVLPHCTQSRPTRRCAPSNLPPTPPCQEGQYYNLTSESCQNCTVCADGMTTGGECGRDHCGRRAPVDVVCCQSYEYNLYGRCYIDCHACVGGLGCTVGRAECRCPEGRYGPICESTRAVVAEKLPKAELPPASSSGYNSTQGTPVPTDSPSTQTPGNQPT